MPSVGHIMVRCPTTSLQWAMRFSTKLISSRIPNCLVHYNCSLLWRNLFHAWEPHILEGENTIKIHCLSNFFFLLI